MVIYKPTKVILLTQIPTKNEITYPRHVSEMIAWFTSFHDKRICIRNLYEIIHGHFFLQVSLNVFEISLLTICEENVYELGTGNELFTGPAGKRSVRWLCLLSGEFSDCLWLFLALFCSWRARSWFSSPGGSSCSECFFLFKDDCSTLILESATTNESLISASSWVSWNSGDDESSAMPRFRRQPIIGLGGGAQGNGDSLQGGVCRSPAIPPPRFSPQKFCYPLSVKPVRLLSYSSGIIVFRWAELAVPSTFTSQPPTLISHHSSKLFAFNSWRHYKIIWPKLTNGVPQKTSTIVKIANHKSRTIAPAQKPLYITSRHRGGVSVTLNMNTLISFHTRLEWLT